MSKKSTTGNRAAFTAGLLLFVIFGIHFINYAPDDIWISLRYAQNLAEGHGLVYNPGEKVEGYSNFLWVLLLSTVAGTLSKADLTLFAKVAGLLLGLASLALVGLGLRRHPLNDGSAPYWGYATLGLGLFVYPAFWSSSGMETGLYLFLVALGLHIYHLFSINRSWLWACISAAFFLALALTRPEGVIFFVAAIAAEILSRIRDRKPVDREILIWGSAFVAGYLVFLFWRHTYFGQWWPNTFYAKAGGGVAKYAEGIRYLLINFPKLLWGNPILLITLALPFFDWRKISPVVMFFGFAIAAQLGFVVFAGGDWMPGARFLVPAMPATAMLIPLSIESVKNRFTGWNSSVNKKMVIAVFLVLVFALALVQLYNAKQTRQDISGFAGYDGERFFKHDHIAVAKWLTDNGSKGDLVALGEAGLIPYLTEMRGLDLFGLIDPYLARLPGLRHQKFDANYVFEKEPAFIVLGGCKIWSDEVTSDFEYARTLLADPRLLEKYDRAFAYHTFLVYRKK